MQGAAKTYGATAKQTSSPRELEADLVLNAAARPQAIQDSWEGNHTRRGAVLHYNRKLWSILVTLATGRENSLPAGRRQNVANLGLLVFNHTMAVLANLKSENLGTLININRQQAAGLLGRA
jgi:flagellar protein FlaF